MQPQNFKKFSRIRKTTLTLVLALCIGGLVSMVASAEDKAKDVKADVVYRNGFVYTVDGMAQVAEAFAVKDGKFVAVGSNDAMKAVTGKDTKVIHLKKKMVMPGLADSHIHALRGALTNLGVKFPFSATPEEAAAATAKFIADNKIKKGEWVVGGTWAFDYRTKGLLEILDKQTPDNPVILHEWTGHIVLVNSAALKAAGFDKNTPNPFAGVIDRDASGNPNGVLHDKALGLVYAKKTPRPADVIKQQAKWIFDKVNSYGVVNVGLAQLDPSRLAAYRALEKQGDLTVRLKGHWDWNTRYVTASMEEQAKTFMTPEKRGPKSALIDVDGVKIYADGVASGHAAPYVEPYEDELTVGEQAIDEPTLTTWMLRFDAAGLQVMTHSFGDMSMRHWINAMEATRKHNGNSGIRHIVEHACNTHPDDLPRLAALQDVIVDISPYQLWIPDPATESWFKLLGYDRMNQTYGIIGSWVRNGITVS